MSALNVRLENFRKELRENAYTAAQANLWTEGWLDGYEQGRKDAEVGMVVEYRLRKQFAFEALGQLSETLPMLLASLLAGVTRTEGDLKILLEQQMGGPIFPSSAAVPPERTRPL